MLRQLHEMRNIEQKVGVFIDAFSSQLIIAFNILKLFVWQKQKTISLDILTQADESIKRKQARKRMFEEQHLSPEKEDNAEM